MDFKKEYNYYSGLIIICFFLFFLFGCLEKEKINAGNTYYIELVNFTKDSLKQKISESIFGKVSFYKKDELVILSVNYVTEDFPDMHYFKNTQELSSNIKPGTRKIKIEFGGEYTVDSIRYSLQKFIYKDRKWVKTSDLGFIKGTTTNTRSKEFSINEFGKQIVNNTVLYTYN